MQIILREDVANLGKRGEVVKVAPGYARNFLIPKRLAYYVTAGIQKQVEVESRAKLSREKREKVEAESLAARLRELTVLRFFRKAGETGTLFGSVTNVDVAEEMAKSGFSIDRKQVKLEEPIKRTGTYRIPVHVYRDVTVEIPVEVEAEAGA